MADRVEPEEGSSPNGGRRKVLIFTASAGGGHVAAAQGVRDALELAGHEAVIVDGLTAMSPRLNWLSVNFYAWQLEHAPWSYGLAFRVLGLPPVVALVRYLVGALWADRMWRILAAERPDAIVSTYPTVTAALGRLRQDGRLGVSVTAIVTDYGPHPMWVSPDIDLHLVPARLSAQLVERAGGRAVVMRFPLGEDFRAGSSKSDARTVLGLPPQAFIPLIVGGAWGVGAVEAAAACAVATGTFPVVVTGRNDALRTRLERRFAAEANVRVLGWTDDLPMLMAAADCLVQHAGGVTCLEAVAVGIPIIFYRPIPGHGLLNAHVMEEAGAAWQVASSSALENVFRRAAEGAIALTPPAREPGQEVVEAVLAMTGGPDENAPVWPGAAALTPAPSNGRFAIGVAAALGIVAFIAKIIRADKQAADHGGAAPSLTVLALWTTLLAGLAVALLGMTVRDRSAGRRRTVAGEDGVGTATGAMAWVMVLMVTFGAMATLEWRYPIL